MPRGSRPASPQPRGRQPRRDQRRRLAALLAVGALLTAGCSGAKSPASPAPDAQASLDANLPTGAPEASTSAAPGASVSAAPGATGAATTGPTGTKPPKGSAPSTGSVKPAGPGTSGFRPSTLFTASEDKIGISASEIKLCAHAALTYGSAFQTTAADFNVFWDELNANGGIFGRKVVEEYVNDDYKPETAIQAATDCKSRNPFLLLGGIGFDQIPAVRAWAEQNRMPYLHHSATVQGAAGKKFSFTSLPSVEKLGEIFAELAISKFKKEKIGIIRRASDNWEPGHQAFMRLAKRHGLNIVMDLPVANQQANYTQQVIELRNSGATVVWAWENALATLEIVKQAKAQRFSPTWLAFPFNLTSQTLGSDALEPRMLGVAMYPAYSKGDTSGMFAPYAADIREFERQYAKHRPNTDLGGVAGDLLFLNWTGQKAIAEMLRTCGRDCTRNKLYGMVEGGFKAKISPGCEVDHTRGDHRLGGYQVNVFETYQASGGKVNWRPTIACREHLI